jgi:hypothetical protein
MLWDMQHDFDTCTHLSCIFLYVTVVLWRYTTLYPKSPIGILAQAVQDIEEWLVIWPEEQYRSVAPE